MDTRSNADARGPDEILRALLEVEAEVLRAAATLDPQAWERPRAAGGWSARELLAHIASIEWTYPRVIDLAREARSGTGAIRGTMRGGNDAYNERQLARRASTPVDALIEEFRRNHAATVEAVRNAEPELWAVPVRSAGGFEGSLSQVFWQVAVEHVRGHARDMAGASGGGGIDD
jgi:uncharacterized protein (TIGR03083 family)